LHAHLRFFLAIVLTALVTLIGQNALQAVSFASPQPLTPRVGALPLALQPNQGQANPAVQLAYSSYLGGNSDEEGRGIARDAAGNLYIIGHTYSTDFGASPNTIAGSSDVFVAKFDSSGKQLLYRTILGGTSSDTGIAIAVNAAGEVAITVDTLSADFPLLRPLLEEKPEEGGVLAKLDATGKLASSTFLNVEFSGARQNVAFDESGNIYITGMYWAGGTEGRENVALYSLSADGSKLLRLEHFGGDWIDKGVALVVTPDGTAYIAGSTEFRDGGFPLSDNAFQKTCGAKSYGANDSYCDGDAFVAVVRPNGEIQYATYLGGKGSDDVQGIGLDSASNVYVAGTTSSQNFPTKQAFQGTWLGEYNFSNGFVTKFTPDLSAQAYSTFLASQDAHGSDYIYGMAVDAAGNTFVTGLTNGQSFPLKDAVQSELGNGVCELGGSERNCYDAYITSFDPNGAQTMSSYLGGALDDVGYAITLGSAGDVWATGQSEASNFPVTSDALQPWSMLKSDAFLTRLGPKNTQDPAGKQQVFLPLTLR
jgi:hypothetical protein